MAIQLNTFAYMQSVTLNNSKYMVQRVAHLCMSTYLAFSEASVRWTLDNWPKQNRFPPDYKKELEIKSSY